MARLEGLRGAAGRSSLGAGSPLMKSCPDSYLIKDGLVTICLMLSPAEP